MEERENRPSRPIHLLALAVSVIFLLANLANFSSGLLQDSNPNAALIFNPFNLQAKLNQINGNLKEKKPGENSAETENEIRSAIRYEPFNAKLFSLLGYAVEKQDDDAAQKLFDYSLKLNQAELLALFGKLQYFARNENPVGAMQIAALIFRAWPQNTDIIAPILPSLLNNPEAYEVALHEFPKFQYAPSRLAGILLASEGGVQNGSRLLLDWQRMGVEGLSDMINLATLRLIRNKQYFQAYSLFLFSRDEQQQKEAGYVFNHNFKLPPSGNPFDWNIVSNPGFSVQIKPWAKGASSNQPDGGIDDKTEADNENGGNELEFKFQNTPVRLDETLQFLRLPKASVIWETKYITRHLKTPKPIKFDIACVDDKKVLATFEVEPLDETQTSQQFDVPVANCDLQTIRIYNENLADSWKNLYQGSLAIRDMTIRLAP